MAIMLNNFRGAGGVLEVGNHTKKNVKDTSLSGDGHAFITGEQVFVGDERWNRKDE